MERIKDCEGEEAFKVIRLKIDLRSQMYYNTWYIEVGIYR